MKTKLKIIASILFLIIITVSFASYDNQEKHGTIFPSPVIELELLIPDPPYLGETANIMATVTYLVDIKENSPSCSANITLPEGIVLVSGDLEWEWNLQPKVSFGAVIKPVQEGNWTIEGKARCPPEGSSWFGGKDFIYLSVKENYAFIQDEPFKIPKECPPGFNCGMSELPGFWDRIKAWWMKK
jgi:hypothetical protein